MIDIQDHSLPSCIDSLPVLGSNSQLTRLPNLRHHDLDEQFPANMQSKYVTVSELTSLDTSPNDLFILHTIRMSAVRKYSR